MYYGRQAAAHILQRGGRQPVMPSPKGKVAAQPTDEVLRSVSHIVSGGSASRTFPRLVFRALLYHGGMGPRKNTFRRQPFSVPSRAGLYTKNSKKTIFRPHSPKNGLRPRQIHCIMSLSVNRIIVIQIIHFHRGEMAK